jgi:DNA-directed RNA polymerase subunit RPC12/RpoP
MTMALYNLHWNEFHSNLATEVNTSRMEEDYCDVNLVTKGGSIKAHRVILAASSSFFKKTLQHGKNQVQEGTIYLRNVTHDDLINIITFIYEGEVKVQEEHLNDFLQVAHDLEIKGLNDDLEPSPMDSSSSTKKTTESNVKQEAGTSGQEEEEEEKEEELGLAQMPDGRVTCWRCGKVFSSMGTGKRHFKNIHETDKADKKFKCRLCDQRFSVKGYMKNHMSSKHGISPKLLKSNVVPKIKPDPEEDSSED